MSKSSNQFTLGRGQFVGNSKVAALCFDDLVVTLNDPILKNSMMSVDTDYYEHLSGFPPKTDLYVPIKQIITLEVKIEGSTGKIYSEVEKGFIQRLLTEDITSLQMIRLVREKLEGRKI